MACTFALKALNKDEKLWSTLGSGFWPFGWTSTVASNQCANRVYSYILACTTPAIAISEDSKGISCIEDFTVQFWETTYIAVLCCAILFCKFETFKISITSHIQENNYTYCLGYPEMYDYLPGCPWAVRDITATHFLWCSAHPGSSYKAV